MKNAIRFALAVALILGAAPQAWADFSIDQPPTETPADPGDILMLGGPSWVDDGDGVPGAPMTLAVPGLLPVTPYDTDGISFAIPNDPFAPAAGAPPGVLVSIDDGDIGPGLGLPDNAVELFFSPLLPVAPAVATNATEALLGLQADPPPINLDDDVDAYEDMIIPPPPNPGAYFSPDADTPIPGLDPGDIYFSNLVGAAPALACNDVVMGITPADPAPAVDVDAVHLVPNYVCGLYPPLLNIPGGLCFLFSVDNVPPPPAPPPLNDPGDIYITDCVNGSVLFLDDVTQMALVPAPDEFAIFDIDAISVPFAAPGACEFDGDGFFDIACGGTDCDDLDPNVFPGAPEICDAKDSDCDLVLPPNEADLDTDQYVQCTPYLGNVPGILGGNDCNDSDANIYPNNTNTNCDCVAPIPQGTTEVCTDGQDNDCDGAIDSADPECGGGTCAGSAAASVHATPGEKEGRILSLLAFLLIPVAVSSGLVFAHRRR